MTTIPAPMGRPPATTRADLEVAAFELFSLRGFEATTVEDIASAAGIGRRTFFRYFASKNDVVWGEFPGHLDGLRSGLDSMDPALAVGPALVEAIVAFNAFPEAELGRHRQRMNLIVNVADLQAHSTLQYAKWRAVVASFAAARTGQAADGLWPQLVSHTALGAALAAYDVWMRDEAASLTGVLRSAFTAWVALTR
jgi:mycofactocin system transcriptional regulator